MRFTGILLLFCPLTALADWAQFRGSDGTGIGDAAKPPPTELTEKSIAWKISLPGRGLSSPIIVGEKIFLTAASGKKQDRLHLFCFSTKDGAKLWERQIQATGRTMCHEKTNVAAPTPCSDGQRVFAQFSSNDVLCTDLAGNVQWIRGLTHDYPNASNSLGMASSPMVVDGVLVAMVENDSDSFTVGLDVATGENRWKMPRKKIANWTSPTLVKSGGKTLAALMSADGIAAVDPATGSEVWKIDCKGNTIPSTAVAGTLLFAPVNGLTAFDLSKPGQAPEESWNAPQSGSATASPLAAGEFVFTVNGAGALAKSRAKDGEQLWKIRLKGPFSGSPIIVGTHLYIANEAGSLIVVDTAAEPEGKIVSELPLNGGMILCTPAADNGALYLRSDSTLWKIAAN